MDMIRNLITIKQNIVIPLSTAAVRTVDTLVNSELTQTVIDTKVNLARTALSVGPRLLDTAVTIAQRKAAVFQVLPSRTLGFKVADYPFVIIGWPCIFWPCGPYRPGVMCGTTRGG